MDIMAGLSEVVMGICNVLTFATVLCVVFSVFSKNQDRVRGLIDLGLLIGVVAIALFNLNKWVLI